MSVAGRGSIGLLAAMAMAGLGVAPGWALAAAPPVSAVASPPAASALTVFLDKEFDDELRMNPQRATQQGRKDYMDRLNDLSEAGQLKALTWRRGSVARLKGRFDRARLSSEERVCYDLWVLELERAELSYRFRRYTTPLGGFLYSVHGELPNFLINTHVVTAASDMAAYNARLRAMGPTLDQAVVRTRTAAADGIRAPRFQYERVISGSQAMIRGQPFEATGADSPLWADAKAKVARLQAAGTVTPAQGKALLDEARAALLASVKPGYRRVIAWAQGDIAKAPSGRVGAVSLPNGKAWYAAALRLNTTTDLSAAQIHEIGLSEVARIQSQMNTLARKAGSADAAAYYAERARLFPPQPWTDAERTRRLAQANALMADSRTRLPAWFGVLPVNRMEVIREPSFSEVAGGAAHAAAPSPDGARPGRVYLHMLGVTDDPANMPWLICHEAVPGHVMQGDIQVRQTGAPQFRRAYGYVAFGEGWGLYSEALCKEMGVYPDIASDFLRLGGELWRASRLVVDTGLHDKGWTEDEAVTYMRDVGRLPEQQARSEVRRYITLAGQATGYKIGMIRIQAARVRAEQALGPKFDIKGFHDLLVSAGSLPLSVMDARVDEWIAARKAD